MPRQLPISPWPRTFWLTEWATLSDKDAQHLACPIATNLLDHFHERPDDADVRQRRHHAWAGKTLCGSILGVNMPVFVTRSRRSSPVAC